MKIVMINSLDALVEERSHFVSAQPLVPQILQERVLGWDCELFDPVSCHVPPATIQISGKERVWVVDGLWLREKACQRAATGLFSLFTQNKGIYHAFMGSCDASYLKECLLASSFRRRFRHMKCFAFDNVLDIEQMARGVGLKQTSLSLYSAFFLGWGFVSGLSVERRWTSRGR